MNKGGDSGGFVYVGNLVYGFVYGRGNDGFFWVNDFFFMFIERMFILGVVILMKLF